MKRNYITTAAVIIIIVAAVLYFHSKPEWDNATFSAAQRETSSLPAIEFNISMNQTLHDDSVQNSTADSSAPGEYLWPAIALALLDIVIIVILIRHILKKKTGGNHE